MEFLKNIKIKVKILMGFGVVVLGIMGVLGIISVNSSNLGLGVKAAEQFKV